MKESLSLIMNNPLLVAQATWILGMLLILALIVWARRAIHSHSTLVRRGEVAVMVDPQSGTFACFQPAGRHLKLPAIHTIKGTISTQVQSLDGHCQADTRDGYQLSLHWVMHYRLDPGAIEPTLQSAMADILLSDPTRIVALQTNHCLEKIIGQHTLETLRHQGVHVKINPQTTRSAVDCLAAYGIRVVTLRVEAIHWPETYKEPNREFIPPGLSEQDLSHQPDLNSASRNQPLPVARSGGSSGNLKTYARIV